MPKIGDPFNPFGLFHGAFVPELLCRYRGLSPGSKLAYARLCRFKGDRGDAFPSVGTMAAEIGVGATQAREYMQELISAGLIRIKPRPGNSNVYEFLWHECFEGALGVQRKAPPNYAQTAKDPQYPSGKPEGSEIGVPLRFTGGHPSGKPEGTPPVNRRVRESMKRVNEGESYTASVPNPVSEEDVKPSLEAQRLDSDVANSVRYADLDGVFSRDEPEKSDRQTWATSDVKKFWAQFARVVPGIKPNAQERARHRSWLEYRTLDDTLTALDGYRSRQEVIRGEKSIEDFKACYYECLKAGMALESSRSDLEIRGTSGITSAQAIAPAPSIDGYGAIAKWNALVPSNPIADWDWERDDVRELNLACSDPVFEKRFEEICTKAESYAQRGRMDRDFRWMLKRYGRKVGNWWSFLTERELPAKPGQESLDEIIRKSLERKFGSGTE